MVLILLLPINLTSALKGADSNWAPLSVVIIAGIPYLEIVLRKTVIMVWLW